MLVKLVENNAVFVRLRFCVNTIFKNEGRSVVLLELIQPCGPSQNYQ